MRRLIHSPIPARSCLLAVLVAGLALGMTTESWAQQPELLPLPDVELREGVEPGVQEVFPQLLETLDQLTADSNADSTQLAGAYGELGRAALYY